MERTAAAGRLRQGCCWQVPAECRLISTTWSGSSRPMRRYSVDSSRAGSARLLFFCARAIMRQRRGSFGVEEGFQLTPVAIEQLVSHLWQNLHGARVVVERDGMNLVRLVDAKKVFSSD